MVTRLGRSLFSKGSLKPRAAPAAAAIADFGSAGRESLSMMYPCLSLSRHSCSASSVLVAKQRVKGEPKKLSKAAWGSPATKPESRAPASIGSLLDT